ncbi:MAG: ABC transporter permease [Lachnospiraceae bacterium]|jgi:putative ABC transport system permease protein|nr:ABC transporter permease [Lachnospiraceae bacterium]
MTFYQLAFRYLKRKKAKTILLFFVLLIVSSMILSTNMILRATADSKAAIGEKTKAKVVMDVLEKQTKITLEDLEQIRDLEEVSALNCIAKSDAYPVNFQLITGSDSAEESNQKVSLLSYHNLENDSGFSEGVYRLISGSFIAGDKKGIVINSYLADANQLQLGDSIELANTDGRSTSLEIVGIFLSGNESKQPEGMDSVNRIENQIFIDHVSYSDLFGMDGYTKVAVYCKDPEQLSELEEELNKILSDKVDTTTSDALYQQMALPLEQITRAAKLMLVLTLLAGIAIVSLLLCMWMRTRQRETAIFISIGKSKASIFLQVCLESFLVFALAVFGSCSLGNLMAGVLQGLFTESETTEISLEVLLQLKDVGVLAGLGSLLVLVAVIISLLPILKTNPKETLSKMEG